MEKSDETPKYKLLSGEMGTRKEWRQEAHRLADRLQYLFCGAYRFEGFGDGSILFVTPTHKYMEEELNLSVDVAHRLVEVAKWGWKSATGAKPLPKTVSLERKFQLVLGEGFQPVSCWDKELLAFKREGDPRLLITHEAAAWIVSVASLGWKQATSPSVFEANYRETRVLVNVEDRRAAELDARLAALREDMQRGLNRVAEQSRSTAILLSEREDGRWARRAAAKIPNYFKPDGPWGRRNGSPLAFVEIDAITPYDGACTGS